MATYCITLGDSTITFVDDADAYCLEGPLTTFFRTRDGRGVIDSWSLRLASFRTSAVMSVQRLEVDSTAARLEVA